MNFGLILRLLGVIIFTLALAFGICYGVSFAPSENPEEIVARQGFLVCTILALALAAGLFWLGRGTPTRIFRKEALAIIGLGWILASAVGAMPYVIIDANTSVVDGIFESASGLTTTGASIYGNVEILPRSLLFWRGLSQWIGGMGVVVFFVAILGFLGAGAKILYSNESSGSTADFDEPRVRSGVMNLWLVYMALSGACVVVFISGGMSVYDALCHMFATVSTGGFSTYNRSMGAFESPFLEWSTTVFMIAAGTSFLLLIQVARGRFQSVRSSSETGAYGFFLAISIIAIGGVLLATRTFGGWHDSFRAAAFQVASIMTTTGFATTDYNGWPTFPKVILLSLMFVGGCSGSTAGGAKVARILLAIRTILKSVEFAFRPNVVRRIQMNGKPVDDHVIHEVLIFLVLIGFLCLGSVPLVSIFEPILPLDAAISSVFACLFNIGPGLGDLGPTQNYAGLHDYTKIMLVLLMIMGRLELYAVLVLFSPQLWRRFR